MHSTLGVVFLLTATYAVSPLEFLWISPAFETYHVYSGEFPCFGENVTGPHELLRFETALFNPGNTEVHLNHSECFFSAEVRDPSTDTLLAEQQDIPLPFLRDSVCNKGRVQLVRGSDFRLSSHCYTVYSPKLSCFWIDVSNLTLPGTVELRLSLAGFNMSIQFDPAQADHNQHLNTTVSSAFVPLFFLTIFFAGFIDHTIHQKSKAPKPTTGINQLLERDLFMYQHQHQK